MADQAGAETRKKGRIGRLFIRAFLGVIGVIQADTHNLARALQRGQVTQLRWIEQTGVAQALMGRLQRVRTGLEQALQGTRITTFLFGQTSQRACFFNGQTFGGAFQKVYETHDHYLCCCYSSVRYVTVPFCRKCAQINNSSRVIKVFLQKTFRGNRLIRPSARLEGLCRAA